MLKLPASFASTGKKKEHKKVKSARDCVPFSELASTPSGAFFQGISFPEISTRPPLGRTELQAAKKVQTTKRDHLGRLVLIRPCPGRGRRTS